MISVVCVYNNEKTLNDYLLKSLKNQTVDYELIALDNTEGKYKSAAEALNHGGRSAKGRYIMFVHQDVDLSSNSWLEEVEKMLESVPNLGIAGVAGKSENEIGVITNIKDGIPPKLAGKIQIKIPTKVQTLDECLIIVPKSVFDMLQFDEKVCDDWHLYGVDYCLDAKKMGFEVYVIPMYIYHLSTVAATKKSRLQVISALGSLPSGYYKTLKKLLNKHKGRSKRIYTTCGNWNTSYPLIFQRIWLLVKAGLTYPFRKLQNKVN